MSEVRYSGCSLSRSFQKYLECPKWGDLTVINYKVEGLKKYFESKKVNYDIEDKVVNREKGIQQTHKNGKGRHTYLNGKSSTV